MPEDDGKLDRAPESPARSDYMPNLTVVSLKELKRELMRRAGGGIILLASRDGADRYLSWGNFSTRVGLMSMYGDILNQEGGDAHCSDTPTEH